MVQAHGFAVENPCYPGTPDVSYIGGWIECKWIRDWPKRAKTPVRLGLRDEQRFWLQLHGRCGGTSWLLVQVEKGQEWLLIPGAVAAIIVGSATKRELLEAAVARWIGRKFDEELYKCLRSTT